MKKLKILTYSLIGLTLMSCVPEHEHNFSTYKDNGTEHYYECECGEISGKEAHLGGTATCTSKAKCDKCGVEYGSVLEHVYDELKHDENKHYYECECGEISQEEQHYGGSSTCTSKAKCDKCGIDYGSMLEHNYSELKYNETEHYYECECGDINGKETHFGGTSTCINKAVCEECEQEYGSLLEHQYTIKKFDEEYHWNECSCSNVDEKIAHTLDQGTITKLSTDVENGEKTYKCNDCEYKKVELLEKIKGQEVDIYPAMSNADIVSYQGRIYTYGGSPDGINRTNSIYCYDTGNGKLYKLNAKLKKESTSHRTILVGDKVYIFGGLNREGKMNYIQVHDLTNQTIEELEFALPFGVNCSQMGYYNNNFYIMGGSLSTGSSDKIYQINIENQTVVELETKLPKKIFKGAWCSFDKYLYLIGGTDGKRQTSIYCFDMETHTLVEKEGVLSVNLSQSRAIYDGEGNIFIYGGTNESNQLVDTIYKYDIEKDECILLDYKLPEVLANTCVTRIGSDIYVLGGNNDVTNTILKINGDQIVNLMVK